MIKIDRSPAHLPDKLRSRAEKSTAVLVEFYKEPLRARIQKNPKFDVAFWKSLKPILLDMFHGKCAYCETKIVGDSGDVDSFRPKFGAINLDKQKAPDHYWWLAYEWENLLFSCRTCNFSKGSKFPVDGERGPLETRLKELRTIENAFLIDPCFDEPDDHLAFGDDGMVSPRTERGRITIEVLNLNRPQLLEERRDEIAQMHEVFTLAIAAGKYSEQMFRREIHTGRPYSAARRQSAHRFLLERPEEKRLQPKIADIKNLIEKVEISTPYISTEEQAALSEEFRTDQKRRDEQAVSTDHGTESLYGKTQWITRFVIHNFRNIEHLEVDLPVPQEGQKPWMVLLGENGMGKSSILKAISLTLMSDETRDSLKITPNEVLRRGTDAGYVEVYVMPYQNPFRLDFNNIDDTFRSNKNVLHTLFFCYGGTRLLPNKFSQADTATDDYSRVINLFNPFLPLIDAETWFLDLPDDRFGYSAKAIKQLITEDDERELKRLPKDAPTEIRLESAFFGTSDSLQTLSDGYQSVIALVSDILEIMLKHYDEIWDSEGIVLIDEIDVHLHPRWKVEIIGMLRKVFPRVQFILTTHDPLCLLGNRPGEVHVLRRNPENQFIEIKQVDVPPGTTADQVLTGFWFGLRSTLDDETLSLLDRHREILREQKPEDDPARIQLENDLRLRLGTFADTSIDRMAQSVASEIISEKIGNPTIAEREDMRNNIRAKLQEMIREKEA